MVLRQYFACWPQIPDVGKMPFNVHRLLLCWQFIMPGPELKQNKIVDDEVNNKCLIRIRLPDIS